MNSLGQQECRICKLCGAQSTAPAFAITVGKGFRARFFCCVACQSLFLSPLPDKPILELAYAGSYYGGEEKKFIAPIERAIEWFRRSRARKIGSFLPPGTRVLDVGCGNGRFLGYLREANFAIEGIELMGKAAERAMAIPELVLHIGEFESIELEACSYEGITLWHVYEHLPHPTLAFLTIERLLKPGGILGISFPNAESLQSKIFGRFWFHLDPPRHLFIPSSSGFLKLAEQHGFEPVEIRHLSFEQNVFGVLQSTLNFFSYRRDLLYDFLKGMSVRELQVSRLELCMHFSIAPVLLPFCLIFAAIEASIRRGGTVEFFLRKKIKIC